MRSRVVHLSLLLCAGLLLPGLGCSAQPPPEADPLPFQPAGPDDAPDPAAFGPYPVGVRTVEYQDTNRRWPDGRARVLAIELWYPATEAARDGEGVHYDIRTEFTEEQRAQLADAEIPLVHTAAVRDAAPRADHGPFPLVIFSHGMGSMRWQSTYLTVFLASHGYVVAAPDHEGDRLRDLLRDEHQPTTFSLEHRPKDVLFLLGRLARLRDDDPLRGVIDTENVGLTGHSFGGLTSLRVAVTEPRVRAIVPQTPTSTDLAWIGLPQPVELAIPVMLQGAHRDLTLKWEEHMAPAWAALQQPKYLLDVVDGGHFTFSDLCAVDLAQLAGSIDLGISQADVEKAMRDGCIAPAPPSDVALPLIRHFAVGFFNGTLRQSPGSLALLSQSAADGLAGPGVGAFTADP